MKTGATREFQLKKVLTLFEKTGYSPSNDVTPDTTGFILMEITGKTIHALLGPRRT